MRPSKREPLSITATRDEMHIDQLEREISTLERERCAIAAERRTRGVRFMRSILVRAVLWLAVMAAFILVLDRVVR